MKTKDFLLYLLVAVFMGVLTSCSGSELKEVSSEDWIEFPEGVSYTVEREGGQLEITFLHPRTGLCLCRKIGWMLLQFQETQGKIRFWLR